MAKYNGNIQPIIVTNQKAVSDETTEAILIDIARRALEKEAPDVLDRLESTFKPGLRFKFDDKTYYKKPFQVKSFDPIRGVVFIVEAESENRWVPELCCFGMPPLVRHFKGGDFKPL